MLIILKKRMGELGKPLPFLRVLKVLSRIKYNSLLSTETLRYCLIIQPRYYEFI